MEENKKLIDEIKRMSTVKAFLEAHNLETNTVDENLLTFYAYKLKFDKCRCCNGLGSCKQNYEGLTPYLDYTSQIVIDYEPCEYLKQKQMKLKKASHLKIIATNFNQYNFEDVYNTKARSELFVKIASIYNNYKNGEKVKGLYLHGPYGCGKSYMLAWLAMKLAALNAFVIFAYYPDLVRKLKNSISEGTLEEQVEELKNIEVLILDDVGGESNSDFIRDEVLGAILQTRMMDEKLTFMSSNLDPKLLVEHLSSGSKDVDLVKGARIYERIKTLMEFMELNDKNYR